MTRYTDFSRFLLVRFHIEYLCQQTTARQVLKALEMLKISSIESGQLDFAYGRALENISNEPPSARGLAFKSLSWLVRAKRPLMVEELRIAVSIEPNRYELDRLDLPAAETIIHVCAGLVTVDGSTIRLAHYSVQEYLLAKDLIPDNARFEHAMACITYLSFESLVDSPWTVDRLWTHPFLDYATHYIDSHLKECDERLSTDMFLNFVENSESVSSWHKSFSSLECYRRRLDRSTRYPLHIASLLGHLAVVRILLDKGADISIRDSQGYTALHLVVYQGNKHVAKLLLDRGADVAARSVSGYTALRCAAASGRKEVVELLLERGADIAASDMDGSTALHNAAFRGHRDVVELLLDRGADIMASDIDGSTALYDAAASGRKEVVEVLLDRGANITAQNEYGNTVLHGAASRGRGETVKLLLERGADATTQNNEGDTALHKAALHGHKEVVLLLSDPGSIISVLNKKQIALNTTHVETHQLMMGGGFACSKDDLETPPAALCGDSVPQVLELAVEPENQPESPTADLNLAHPTKRAVIRTPVTGLFRLLVCLLYIYFFYYQGRF